MFGENAINDWGTDAYFGNYGRALSTCFRMYTSEVCVLCNVND